MVAGILCQAILLNPGGFDELRIDSMREDVIHALTGELRGERAGGVGILRIGRAERIDIAAIQHTLDDSPRNLVAVGFPFLARRRFALGGIDLLAWRVGVEIAAENMRTILNSISREAFEHVLQ